MYIGKDKYKMKAGITLSAGRPVLPCRQGIVKIGDEAQVI